MHRAVLLMLVALTSASASTAQTAEPLVGVWQVDIFKSTYFTSQPPIKRTITFVSRNLVNASNHIHSFNHFPKHSVPAV